MAEVLALSLVAALVAVGNWQYSTRPVPRPRAVSWRDARLVQAVIVDSRSAAEYARDHLPGAQWVAPGTRIYPEAVLDRSRRVAVYGSLPPSSAPWQVAVELMGVRGDEVMVITDPPLFVGPR